MLRISTETVSALLGMQSHRYRLVDCRFGYEYEGGHVRGAENFGSRQDIVGLIEDIEREPGGAGRESDLVIVFYCEYSSIRAPKLASCLRNEDRKMNVYPNLLFPHIYVMEGGYKEFFRKFPGLCSPEGYVPMRTCIQAGEVIKRMESAK